MFGWAMARGAGTRATGLLRVLRMVSEADSIFDGALESTWANSSCPTEGCAVSFTIIDADCAVGAVIRGVA
jgi:hypothetical protein